MKRRVCCLLLGLSILCLPVQQAYAAPAGPAAHEHEHPKHNKKEHKHPVPPHEKKHEHPVPHEEKKGPLAETPVTSTTGSELVNYALQFVGNPYKYGGTSLTKGADCSGFVQSVFAHFDYSLERTSRDQAKTAGYTDVSLKESELQPGDLIFYANSSGAVYHVAIYIGDGKVVHAANSEKGITVSEYTYMKPYKARRVIA